MLASCVNDDTFVSLEGKSKHQLWLELCDVITRHPDEVTAINVDAILRSGIRKFTDEVCWLVIMWLWCEVALISTVLHGRVSHLHACAV